MKAVWSAAVLLLAMSTASVTVVAQSSGDKKFLETGSQGNLAEVEIAKLALKKSSNPSVRSFAERMIKDHEMLAKKMQPFMTQAGVQPSTKLNMEHQHLYNKLNGLNGAEFDKQYVEAMSKDHHEDLEDYQKEASSTQMSSLKVAVQGGQKVIEEHTRMIDGISRQMGMQPAGGS